MGTYAELRTDTALAAALETTGHTPTTLARTVSAYGRPVSRQMIAKLANPTARWSGRRRCRVDLAVVIATVLRMPVEFLFVIHEPAGRKPSPPRVSMPSVRKSHARSAQNGRLTA